MGRPVKQAFGKMGETWVADVLRERGHQVAEIGTRSSTDLVVDGLVTVEVKSATMTKRKVQRGGEYGGWMFSFGRNGRPNDDDFAVLVCFSDEMESVGVFVIPKDNLGLQRKTARITRENPDDYAGQWAEFRDRWDLITDLVEIRKKEDPEPLKPPDPIPF
jgi:hypothetical protein